MRVFLQKAIPILKRHVPFCHPLVTTLPTHSVDTTNQEARISEDYFVFQIDLITSLLLFFSLLLDTQSPFQINNIASPSYPVDVLHDVHEGNKNTSNQVTQRPDPVFIPGRMVARPFQRDEFRGAKRVRREECEEGVGEEPRGQAFITAGDQYVSII